MLIHELTLPECREVLSRTNLARLACSHADQPYVVLTAQPSFEVPQFLLKRLLKRDSGEMIDGLRREIAARSAR